MTKSQKHWAIGAGIGGLALVGYEVWKHRGPSHAHEHHGGHGHHHHGGGAPSLGPSTAIAPQLVEVPGSPENARGEYGRHHRHHHHHHEERARGEY